MSHRLLLGMGVIYLVTSSHIQCVYESPRRSYRKAIHYIETEIHFNILDNIIQNRHGFTIVKTKYRHIRLILLSKYYNEDNANRRSKRLTTEYFT